MKRAKAKTDVSAKVTRAKKGSTAIAAVTRKAAKKQSRAGASIHPHKGPKPWYHGDPVLVDDGGSFRIGQNGSRLSGLIAKHATAGGNFTDLARFAVISGLGLNGKVLTLQPLLKRDVITIITADQASGSHWVTLTVHNGGNAKLDIESDLPATETGSTNTYVYEIPNTGQIVTVTRTTRDGFVYPVFDINDYTGISNITVVVSKAG